MSLLSLFLSLTLVMVRQMTDGERWRAIGMLDAGMSIRDVARTVGRSHTAIRKLLIKTRATGSVSHASSGRPRRRCTNVRADRRLIRLVRGNPTMPATLLRLMWDQRNRQGNLLSSQTIRRRIKETALRCRRMRKRQRLSPAHVASRERWAMQRIHWRQNQWQRVIFTDESRFRLFRADGRIRVWREPRQDLLPQHVQIAEQQGISLHVWAGITANSRTDLVFLERNVNGQTYGDLLQTQMMPFIERTFGGAQHCILQDDNAAPHRAAEVQRLKHQLGLRTLRWPSRSPDMNPIEHVWSYMKRQIRQHPPGNVRQLRQMMTDAWRRLPQELLRRLILSMPRRVTSLLLARGGYTRY